MCVCVFALAFYDFTRTKQQNNFFFVLNISQSDSGTLRLNLFTHFLFPHPDKSYSNMLIVLLDCFRHHRTKLNANML